MFSALTIFVLLLDFIDVHSSTSSSLLTTHHCMFWANWPSWSVEVVKLMEPVSPLSPFCFPYRCKMLKKCCEVFWKICFLSLNVGSRFSLPRTFTSRGRIPRYLQEAEWFQEPVCTLRSGKRNPLLLPLIGPRLRSPPACRLIYYNILAITVLLLFNFF